MSNIFNSLVLILVVSCQLSPPQNWAGSPRILAEVVSYSAESPEHIRVVIIKDAPSVNLQIRGPYEIINSESQGILFAAKDLMATVIVSEAGILIENKIFNADRVFIKVAKPEAISIDGRRFRGYIQLIKKENLRIWVINFIELEDYVRGVLYHEVSHHWPFEALKAQAIACRTFALYQAKENISKDYDVTSDIYSQVYGGRVSERYRTNKAINETKGQVLTCQGEIFPAYYHATCAGHTEDASVLWNIDLSPLRGVICNFCKDSPHYRWHSVLALREIEQKLYQSIYRIINIKNILILDKDASGRVTNLRLSSENKEIEISAKDFRNILGPNIIKSANFDVSISGQDAVFEGLGWGHGVGLCQWGAYFMARQEYTAQQILEYYYPGTEISLIK